MAAGESGPPGSAEARFVQARRFDAPDDLHGVEFRLPDGLGPGRHVLVAVDTVSASCGRAGLTVSRARPCERRSLGALERIPWLDFKASLALQEGDAAAAAAFQLEAAELDPASLTRAIETAELLALSGRVADACRMAARGRETFEASGWPRNHPMTLAAAERLGALEARCGAVDPAPDAGRAATPPAP